MRLGCRRDAKTCSKKCRQARHRFRVGVAPVPQGDVAGASSQPRQVAHFAYADPPYPGLAKKYYGPGAQEVNHRILIGTLQERYPDGWALSTSAAALGEVLSLCPGSAQVAVWVKGSRAALALRARNAWEPVIVVGGRMRRMEPAEGLDDVLVWGGRQHSHPGALVGMKSAAFCEWVFRLLGAERQDTMTDIFPGSGAVSRAWNLYTSHGATATSRLSEAQGRLAGQLEVSHLET